jgi:hypothetical protein
MTSIWQGEKPSKMLNYHSKAIHLIAFNSLMLAQMNLYSKISNQLALKFMLRLQINNTSLFREI